MTALLLIAALAAAPGAAAKPGKAKAPAAEAPKPDAVSGAVEAAEAGSPAAPAVPGVAPAQGAAPAAAAPVQAASDVAAEPAALQAPPAAVAVEPTQSATPIAETPSGSAGVVSPAGSPQRSRSAVALMAQGVFATDGWGADRNWSLWGTTEVEMPVIIDRDPANDIWMEYRFGGTYQLLPSLTLGADTWVDQEFTRESRESPVTFGDTSIWGSLSHTFDLPQIKKSLTVLGGLGVVAPTSRQSVREDKLFGITQNSMILMPLGGGFRAGVSQSMLGQVHRFAQAGGQQAGGNLMFAVGAQAFVAYVVPIPKRAGRLELNASSGLSYRLKQAARDGSETDTGVPQYSAVMFRWTAGVSYTPVPYLTFNTALRHGDFVRQDGVVKVDVFRRELTRMAFSVTARY